MSVAFRREQDDEHLEPRFERPVPPGPNLVTPRGLGLIAAEIADLERRLADAAEADRPTLARDLRYWRARQATARIPAPPADGEIGFGSRVTYRMGETSFHVEIVGTDEADPESGRIGFMAPLARTLIGAGEGDHLSFRGRDDAIAVVAVN